MPEEARRCLLYCALFWHRCKENSPRWKLSGPTMSCARATTHLSEPVKTVLSRELGFMHRLRLQRAHLGAEMFFGDFGNRQPAIQCRLSGPFLAGECLGDLTSLSQVPAMVRDALRRGIRSPA